MCNHLPVHRCRCLAVCHAVYRRACDSLSSIFSASFCPDRNLGPKTGPNRAEIIPHEYFFSLLWWAKFDITVTQRLCHLCVCSCVYVCVGGGGRVFGFEIYPAFRSIEPFLHIVHLQHIGIKRAQKMDFSSLYFAAKLSPKALINIVTVPCVIGVMNPFRGSSCF